MESTNNKFNRRLSLFLDGALSENDRDQFINDVNASDQKKEELENERAFRSFLKNKITRKTASQSIKNSIRDSFYGRQG